MVIGNLPANREIRKDSLQSHSSSPVFDIDKSQIALLKEAGFKFITIENDKP